MKRKAGFIPSSVTAGLMTLAPFVAYAQHAKIPDGQYTKGNEDCYTLISGRKNTEHDVDTLQRVSCRVNSRGEGVYKEFGSYGGVVVAYCSFNGCYEVLSSTEVALRLERLKERGINAEFRDVIPELQNTFGNNNGVIPRESHLGQTIVKDYLDILSRVAKPGNKVKQR